MKRIKYFCLILLCFVSFFGVACKTEEPKTEFFTVTLVSDNTTYKTLSIANNSKIEKPTNPEKEGYEFDGWYLDDEKWSFSGYVVTSNITLTAKWNKITFTATFVVDNSTIETQKFTKDNLSLTNPSIPNKDGYTSKWEDYTLTEEDITISAIYTPINYSIEYVLDNGTNSTLNPTQYNIETNDITLNNPQKDNHLFLGWYDNANFTGQSITTIKKGSTGKIILYAKYYKTDSSNSVIIQTASDFINYSSDVSNYTKNAYLVNDIDLAGYDFLPIGNINNPYSALLYGNNHTIKNISINVTTKNFANYIFSKVGNTLESYAHIGVFGDTNNAVIENIKFTNITINVSDDIYDYIQNDLWNDHKSSLVELTIGGLVACAENTTINANVNATINANSYGIYSEGQNNGRNFIGGIVGYANNSSITNLNTRLITTTIIADDKGSNSYIGGIVGGLYSSNISSIDLTTNITSTSKSKFYIGGVAGYVSSSNISNLKVNLTVKQVETERYSESDYIQSNTLLETYNAVGGIASVIRVDNDKQLSIIKDVKVFSDIAMDCIFGGAIFKVNSTDTTENSIYVTLTNITLNSKVNVLKAYGIGYIIPHTKVEYTDDYIYSIAKNKNGNDAQYNILLTGSILINSSLNAGEYSTAIISQNRSNASLVINLTKLKVLVSNSIYEKFGYLDKLNNLISTDFVD